MIVKTIVSRQDFSFLLVNLPYILLRLQFYRNKHNFINLMSNIKNQLEEQIAEVDWKDLIPHAQRDAIVIVHPPLNLIDVGCAIAEDKTNQVQNWISEQLLQKPTAEQLSNWNSDPTQKFTTIIIQPFVLIDLPKI